MYKNNICDNCELMKMLEEDRMEWYKRINLENVKLHAKIIQQRDQIAILKDRSLMRKITQLTEVVHRNIESINSISHESSYSSELKHFIKRNIEEVDIFLQKINDKVDRYIEKANVDYDDLSEHTAYFKGVSEYYRTALFDEMRKSRDVKRHYMQQISLIKSSIKDEIANQVQDQSQKIHKELKNRYKESIKSIKEELMKQEELVKKLRQHNKKIYWTMVATTKENETQLTKTKKELEDAKKYINFLQRRHIEDQEKTIAQSQLCTPRYSKKTPQT